MATTLNFCLDTRAVKGTPPGNVEFPIKLTITKNGSTAYLATGIKVLATCWKDRKVTGRQDKGRLNDSLDSLKNRVRTILNDNIDVYRDKSATEIKNDIARKLDGSDEQRELFLPYFESFANKRKSNRTKEIYLVTLSKIKALVPHAERLKLGDIDLDFLEDFDDLLVLRGNNDYTRSLDFRNIRAVLNDARKHKLMKEYPFDCFKMPSPKSRNRALTIEQMKRLVHAEVKPFEEKYLDFFLLSFLLIGINTGDLMHADAIVDGRINYVRHKTGQDMSVKVEKEAMDIIEKYRGKTHLINVMDTYAETKTWTSKVDAHLKDIATRNGLPKISMYWARHTWATIVAADMGEGITMVSDAFGHQTEKKVTSVYVWRKNYTTIDAINRKVIDLIFCDEDSTAAGK